uniref:C-type-lectin-like-10 protein n=1 Tax=Pagurus bernhardus TaxID=174397 RepID=W6MES7_PAGBR
MNAFSPWLGGSDLEVEGVWRWVTGQLMPMGAPFWATTDSYAKEPTGGGASNCALMYQVDRYYIHDVGCDNKYAPLCQKSKII